MRSPAWARGPGGDQRRNFEMQLSRVLRRYWQRRRGGPPAAADTLCVALRARQELSLRDAAAWVVECRSGALWITQEADARDVMVEAGERFELDRNGLTLVSALDVAVAAVHAPAGASRCRGYSGRTPADLITLPQREISSLR